jgi:hypothetical protein
VAFYGISARLGSDVAALPRDYLRAMQPGFPSVWILFVLPFASSGVIAHARPLRKLSTRHNRFTLSVGFVGLGAFVAGMVGLLPAAWAILAVVAGGALVGFSIFSLPPKHTGGEEGPPDDGGGWGRRPPPEDEPRPPVGGGGELDWDQFDQLRAQWERTLVK